MDRSLKNKYKTDSLYRFLLPEVFFRVFLRFYLILFYISTIIILLVSPCQILDDRFIEHLGIYLCCLDRCMPQKFLDGGYRNALVNQESGTSVSACVVGGPAPIRFISLKYYLFLILCCLYLFPISPSSIITYSNKKSALKIYMSLLEGDIINSNRFQKSVIT